MEKYRNNMEARTHRNNSHAQTAQRNQARTLRNNSHAQTAQSNQNIMTTNLEKFLLDELTCPSCYNYMCPPINQCQKGHNVCNECFPKVNICPKCRSPKSSTSRNYALEAIHGKLLIPCKYQYLGCDYICLGENIKSHQKYCKITKKECPFTSYDNCQWKDSIIKLKIHLLKKHAHNFYQKDKQKFISQHFRNISSYHYIFAVIYIFDNYFRLTWDINESTGMTRWAVYFMGSPEDAKKYSYKLEFTKGLMATNSVPLTFKSVCDPKPDKESAKFGNHNCFYIHKSLLDKYCIDNGDLHYRVSIYSLNEEEEYTSDIALLFVEGRS